MLPAHGSGEAEVGNGGPQSVSCFAGLEGETAGSGINAMVSGLLSGYAGATPQGLCEVNARQRGEAEPRTSRTSLIGSECQENRRGWREQSPPQES